MIAGHLGADPVSRFTSSGQKVTTFNIAVNSRKGGADITTWYRVTIWGDRFDKMVAHLKKGSAVMVMGELKAEIWVDKEGRSQLSLEVTAEMLRFSPFGKGERSNESSAHQPQAAAASHAAAAAGYGAFPETGFGEQTFGGFPQGGSSENEDMPF
jgi:single-strand DNA-binding protein